jgi:hypothetical protein
MCETPRPAGPRPRCGMLDAIGLVTVVMTLILDRWAASRALDAVVVAAGFLALAGWLRRNAAALDRVEWCECAAARLTVRVVASRRPEVAPFTVADRRPAEEELEEAPLGR